MVKENKDNKDSKVNLSLDSTTIESTSSEVNTSIVQNVENPDYLPIVFHLQKPSEDIFKYKSNPVLSDNIAYPKFSYGFHHYIHQSKDKMEFTKEFTGKKKVYYIVNKFETTVDDYDVDINKVSKAYFDIDPKPNILSRAFYKIWELFFMFDLIPTDDSAFTTAHLAEGPGSFIQATMMFRDKFSKKNASKNDKYYAVTLHSDKYNVPKLEESFISYYKKEKPQRFELHRTYSRDVARQSDKKDDGDLTSKKTRKLFDEHFVEKKADFITADGGFEWENENVQEQEAFKLILSEIITAVKIQKKGGSFVCKLYESFTQVTAKFIAILCSFYDDLYIVKPLMSRASNSEKYIVCMGFKDNKDNNKKIETLEDIIEDMNDKPKKNLLDLFPEYEIDNAFKTMLISINTSIANKQFININLMKSFVDKQNYRGDEYQQRRQEQINATKYWLDLYFPESNEYKNRTSKIKKLCEEIEDEHKIKINALMKQLV